MTLMSRLASRTPEEAARRQFGLWAGGALIVLLPLWWIWGADIVAGLLRPFVGLVLTLFGLGPIEVTDHGWSIGSPLTENGRPMPFAMTTESLRRLLIGFPLVTAFLIAPPRPSRPWRAALVSIVVLSVLFALSVVAVTWGSLAPLLDPALAPVGKMVTVRSDQPPLNPLLAQIAIVGRYTALSIVPLLAALLLWATLNPVGLKTLVAEITE